jgi:hypothetical protein
MMCRKQKISGYDSLPTPLAIFSPTGKEGEALRSRTVLAQKQLNDYFWQ